MAAKHKIPIWPAPALLLFAAGFVVAALWDLPVTQRLYNPNSIPALWVECFGWYPAFLPTLLGAMLYIPRYPHQGKARPAWQVFLAFCVLMGGSFALFLSSYNYMEGRDLAAGFVDYRGWLWLSTVIIPGFIVFYAVFHFSEATVHRLRFFARWGTVYMLANQLIVYLLKFIWQRTRFDIMLWSGEGFGAFTPWYLSFGNGGSSFPSGHTANAAGIFMLLVLCDLFARWNKHRKFVYCVCWAYILFAGFCRMQIGRHFLSDVLAAAGIMALLFFAMRHSRFYQKGLLQTLAQAETRESFPGGMDEL